MIESIKIKQISEADFDGVIDRAGGSRLSEEGSADYILNESIIELKLLEEEGLEKDSRRAKLASLFRGKQAGRPVVIIDPKALDDAGRREYYNILEGPIKTHVKKASKQLEKTAAARHLPSATRVLAIVNIGYTALLPDEFKALCVKCAQNDTTKIDLLICAGVYYFSDGFDSWILTRFEDVPINLDRPFHSFEKLCKEWAQFLNEAMAEHIRNGPLEAGTLPIIDLAFDLDGIRYVKPMPRLPRSEFWPGGVAPRVNSRENEPPRPMGKSFPALLEEDWRQFKRVLPHAGVLQDTYREWRQLELREERDWCNERQPFVPVYVEFGAFASSMSKPEFLWEFRDLCKFANDLLNGKVREVLENVKNSASTLIVPIEFLHVVVENIGRDQGNDICTIRHICELPGFRRNDVVVENIRANWEEGVCLAAFYAVKRGVPMVMFENC